MTKIEYINKFKFAPFSGKNYKELLKYYDLPEDIRYSKAKNKHLTIISWTRAVCFFILIMFVNSVKVYPFESWILNALIQLGLAMATFYIINFIMHYLLLLILMENKEY